MSNATEKASADIFDQRLCIACEECKPLEDFSLEHIFPDSLGGNRCSFFFKTRHVCRACNSTMGAFVDAPFVRSWFVKNGVMSMLEFVDLNSDTSWVPLIYMGQSNVIDLPDGEVCEIWIGPSGEHLYHFHEKDDYRYDSFAGGNPIARKKYPGRAYIFLTHSDAERIGLLFRSVAKSFKKAKRFAGNFSFDGKGLSRDAVGIHALPSEFENELQALKSRIAKGADWKIELAIQLGFEQRFFAKFARSIGFKLFGERYLTTARAQELKAALWEQDYEKRSEHMKSSSIFDDTLKAIRPLIGVKGIYTVTLMPTGDILSLVLTMPSGNVLATYISDESDLWGASSFDYLRDGVMYFIAPQINFFHGPVGLPQYLHHKLHGPTIPQLIELERHRIGWRPLNQSAK